jgi:aconitase B
MVGKACGVAGILPGTYCEPKMTTVGSQDTTGPMTRDELKDLACLGFSADLVMQSFCHTRRPTRSWLTSRPTANCRRSSRPVAAFRCVRATASSTPG